MATKTVNRTPSWTSSAAVQNETLGHQGRKSDPLYRARRLFAKAHEGLDENGNSKVVGLFAAGAAGAPP
jgi:hypothetical protein